MNLTYSFHARQPVFGLNALTAEHERITALWDELVDIDRLHEQRTRDACADAHPEYAQLLQEMADLTVVIRSDDTTSDDRRRLVRQRRDVERRSWEWLARWRKEHKEAARQIETDRQQAVKQARQKSPAWWPNYNSVVQRHEAARTVARQTGRRLRYHDDDRDDGVLCAQIQRTRTGLGAAPEEIIGGTLSMIAISEPDSRGRCTAEMRVDAAGNLARIPLILHRPLPRGSRVKGVQLTWRRRADGMYWALHMQIADVTCPEPIRYQRPGALTLDWTLSEHTGLHVAAIDGQDLILSPRWCARMERVRELRAWMDKSRKRMAAARPDLDAILDLPEREMMSGIIDRFRTAATPSRQPVPRGEHAMETVRRWADEAAAAGDALQWRRWWKHVWQARLHLWDKLLGERREAYRLWARRVVREYTDITMDDTRLDRVARADRGTDENTARQMAAVHTLRAEIIHQARKYGSRVTASGKVLTDPPHQKSGAWQRRKAARAERSKTAHESAPGRGDM